MTGTSGHDASLCARIVRTHARTFHLASFLLPPHKRRGAYALYAFCRLADDMVDDAARSGGEDTRAQLQAYRHSLDEALAGRPTTSVMRELCWAARRFSLPADPLHELLDGVARDLDVHDYRSWTDLEHYCAGVASSVGEMCSHVFGIAGDGEAPARAIAAARTLGVAMQLTNILRDVGEDAGRNRCYLPEDELASYGLSTTEVLDGTVMENRTGWNRFMAAQIARARHLYAQAEPGIALLAPDAQRCALASARGYARILDVIEQNAFDTVSRRARLGWPARASVLVQCLWGGVAGADAPRDRADGPEPSAAANAA
jgi:15-cis-phytoene synthase